MQQYAAIYLLQNHSTCFGCPSYPSSGVHKTVTAASGTGHSIWAATFLQRGHIWPRWRKVVAVPEAAVTLLCTPDDGGDGHPKYVESDFALNKYLHTVVSCWILLIYNYDKYEVNIYIISEASDFYVWQYVSTKNSRHSLLKNDEGVHKNTLTLQQK